jgi:hypothetical protein
MPMPSHDEPVLRTELLSLDDFASLLAAGRGPEPHPALAHALDRVRRQNPADVSSFQSSVPQSADPGSAIG